MKPTRTWIVLANARQARIVEHKGVGHGLHDLPDRVFDAKAPLEYTDRQGTGHRIAGPATNAVYRSDPQDQANLAFAQTINAALGEALDAGQFDRLVVVAGPDMLGLLRKVRQASLADVLLGEVDKDLTRSSLDQVETILQDVFLV